MNEHPWPQGIRLLLHDWRHSTHDLEVTQPSVLLVTCSCGRSFDMSRSIAVPWRARQHWWSRGDQHTNAAGDVTW